MSTIHIGYACRTRACSNCSNSSEKKSRVRRSKAERKSMVESYIKKYQKLNNGSFPSVCHTHKEVGGSFYIVREIVREVIQENKVLGPSKHGPEGDNADGFFKQYPLGSVSMDPLPQRQSLSEETGGQYPLESCNPDFMYNEGIKSEGDGRSLQTGRPLVTETVGVIDGGRNTQHTISRFTDLSANVVVETFPLQSAAESSHRNVDRKCDMWEVPEKFDAERIGCSNTELCNGSSHIHGSELIDVHEETSARIGAAEPSHGSVDTTHDMREMPQNIDAEQIGCSNAEFYNQNSHIHGSESMDVHEETSVMVINDNIDMGQRDLLGGSPSFGESLVSKSEDVLREAGLLHCDTSRNAYKMADVHIPKDDSTPLLGMESGQQSLKERRAESNIFPAFLQAFITTFVKFWPL